jgi:hypothetical protein
MSSRFSPGCSITGGGAFCGSNIDGEGGKGGA